MALSTNKPATKKYYEYLLALATWVTLGLQLYLTTGSVINYFSYFTILCNLSVALTLTFSAVAPTSGIGKFISGPSAQTAIALYIFIVGLVYNLVLRGILQLSGLAFVVDNMLHVVIPVLYIVYWFLFVPKGTLRWKNLFSWMIFPILYLVYSLVRGSMVHWYPYPFLNADQLGYPRVFLNILVVVVVFFVTGSILIASNRSKKSR